MLSNPIAATLKDVIPIADEEKISEVQDAKDGSEVKDKADCPVQEQPIHTTQPLVDEKTTLETDSQQLSEDNLPVKDGEPESMDPVDTQSSFFPPSGVITVQTIDLSDEEAAKEAAKVPPQSSSSADGCINACQQCDQKKAQRKRAGKCVFFYFILSH